MPSLNWQLNNGWNVKLEIPVHFESGRITDTRSAHRHTGRANFSTIAPNLYINRYFTTQIYAHARYDSKTPRTADSSWHKFQLKEIFSIGFSYKFSSL